jgi:hypothetical protein
MAGSLFTFADFEANVTPVNCVDGGWWESHCKDTEEEKTLKQNERKKGGVGE